MTTKKKVVPVVVKKRTPKTVRKAGDDSPQRASETPSGSSPPSLPVSDALTEPVATANGSGEDTTSAASPLSIPATEPSPQALAAADAILQEAVAARQEEPPVVTAATSMSEADALLSEVTASSPEPSPAPKKHGGGWPKGRPRKPSTSLPTGSSAFPQRATGATGSSDAERELARMQARVQELETMHSESVKTALVQGFAQITRVGFGLLARRQGSHWNLTKQEQQELGEACTTCALPYISYVGPALPFIALAGTFYAVVAPRLEIDEAIAAGTAQQVMTPPALVK